MKPNYMRSRPQNFRPNQNGLNGSQRNGGRNNGRNNQQRSGGGNGGGARINPVKVSRAGWKDQEKRGIAPVVQAPASNSNTRKDKINISAKLNVAGYRTRKINVKDTSEIFAMVRRRIYNEFKKENIENYPTNMDELAISYNGRIIAHGVNQESLGVILGLNNKKPGRRKRYTLMVTFNGLQPKQNNNNNRNSGRNRNNRSQQPVNGRVSAVPPGNNNNNNGGSNRNNRRNRSRNNARSRGCAIM